MRTVQCKDIRVGHEQILSLLQEQTVDDIDATDLAGVGVIKPHQHCALVLLRKVLVQEGSFGMPYVQIA